MKPEAPVTHTSFVMAASFLSSAAELLFCRTWVFLWLVLGFIGPKIGRKIDFFLDGDVVLMMFVICD
jgi:hypothetical protein